MMNIVEVSENNDVDWDSATCAKLGRVANKI